MPHAAHSSAHRKPSWLTNYTYNTGLQESTAATWRWRALATKPCHPPTSAHSGEIRKLARSSTSNRRDMLGAAFVDSRRGAKSQRTQSETGAMMEMTNTADRFPRSTSSGRLAISARREKARFKRLGQNGREHLPSWLLCGHWMDPICGHN